MGKHEFMARLYNALKNLTPQEREDILNDYEEHFRIGLEMGKSEAEIADSLGSPEELAASFTEDAAVPPPAEESPRDPEDYGDNWHTEAYPFEQNASQYQDYYDPEASAGGTYGSAPEQGRTPSGPPPYPVQGGIRTGMMILMVCLTVFLVIPAGIPCFFAILAAIVALAFAAGWLGASMLIFYGSTAAWLIAGIALLCLCACLVLCLISYISGGCKLAAKYIRFFGRTVSGRKEALS